MRHNCRTGRRPRVRADYTPSAESVAADKARQVLFDAAGDDWASVLVNPRTPEERALVEDFLEAETRWMDTPSTPG
jgi:hypothetical protein